MIRSWSQKNKPGRAVRSQIVPDQISTRTSYHVAGVEQQQIHHDYSLCSSAVIALVVEHC